MEYMSTDGSVASSTEVAVAGSPPRYSKRKLSKQHQLSYFDVEVISPMRSDLLVISTLSVF